MPCTFGKTALDAAAARGGCRLIARTRAPASGNLASGGSAEVISARLIPANPVTAYDIATNAAMANEIADHDRTIAVLMNVEIYSLLIGVP